MTRYTVIIGIILSLFFITSCNKTEKIEENNDPVVQNQTIPVNTGETTDSELSEEEIMAQFKANLDILLGGE